NTGIKYNCIGTVAETFTYRYPVPVSGLLSQGPEVDVANVTVAFEIVVVFRFQVLTEFVTALRALVIPEEYPFSLNAASRAAASQNTCVSFLAMNARPTSTARPRTPIKTNAATAIVISTNPRSCLREAGTPSSNRNGLRILKV